MRFYITLHQIELIGRHFTLLIKLIFLLKSAKDIRIQSFDIDYPVYYLAIRQWSKDLEHLISRNGLPELQG